MENKIEHYDNGLNLTQLIDELCAIRANNDGFLNNKPVMVKIVDRDGRKFKGKLQSLGQTNYDTGRCVDLVGYQHTELYVRVPICRKGNGEIDWETTSIAMEEKIAAAHALEVKVSLSEVGDIFK